MTDFRVFALFAASAFAACSNPGLDYANKHSELTPVQRQIITSGKIPAGDAVAGLTHDQVKVAMRGFPNTFDKVNGEEAWIYVRKKALPVGEEQVPSPSARRDSPDASFPAAGVYDMNERTTVYFQGDRATHAEVTQEK